MSKLETEVGARLVERSGAGIRLTDVGAVLAGLVRLFRQAAQRHAEGLTAGVAISRRRPA